MRIERNTTRFLKYFEEIADELMPSTINIEDDVFDVLNVIFNPSLSFFYSFLTLLLSLESKNRTAESSE